MSTSHARLGLDPAVQAAPMWLVQVWVRASACAHLQTADAPPLVFRGVAQLIVQV